jgi:hypothetical protein
MRLDPRQIEAPDELMAEVLRRKSPQERLRIGFNMWVSARNMLMTHIRHSHPDWSLAGVEHEVARRMSRGTV